MLSLLAHEAACSSIIISLPLYLSLFFDLYPSFSLSLSRSTLPSFYLLSYICARLSKTLPFLFSISTSLCPIYLLLYLSIPLFPLYFSSLPFPSFSLNLISIYLCAFCANCKCKIVSLCVKVNFYLSCSLFPALSIPLFLPPFLSLSLSSLTPSHLYCLLILLPANLLVSFSASLSHSYSPPPPSLSLSPLHSSSNVL